MRPFRALTALACAAAVCGGCGGSDESDEPASAPQRLELQRNRHGGVYMGVRCLEPNSVACDRVGLAVWLADPAKSLTAVIEGRPLTLRRDREWANPDETPWIGSLKPAGLRHPCGALHVAREPGQPADFWSGVKPVDARIRLTASYEDGTTATRTVRAPLHPGWG